MSATLAEVRGEIEALHVFFAGWFTGAIAEDDGIFARDLASHLHPDFEIVLPSGNVMHSDGLLTAIRRGWGSNPGFRIEIHEVRLIAEWPECGLVLATYVEAQFGARNTTPPDNRRRSSVLFERRDDRLLRRHVHECGLDAN